MIECESEIRFRIANTVVVLISGEEEHYDSSPSPGSCYDTASESAPYGPDSGNFIFDTNNPGKNFTLSISPLLPALSLPQIVY
jgi:hypothetical protein